MKWFQLNLDDLNLKLNETNFDDFNEDKSFERFYNIFTSIVILMNP